MNTTISITRKNIKEELKVGDKVSIADSQPVTVTYTYWNNEGIPIYPEAVSALNTQAVEMGFEGTDLGFEVDSYVVFNGDVCDIIGSYDVEEGLPILKIIE